MAPGGKEPEQQWPPRSPHEALLSTPKGRERYREMLQTSPSPSPSRGNRLNVGPPLSASVGLGINEASDDDEDDEETLQLKLQEIQAKLRLKKLQNARGGKSGSGGTSGGRSALSASPSISDRQQIPKSPRYNHDAIEVPASPVRKLQATQPQTSPSRVLLGIDKGLTAKDISLKRAPSHKRLNSALSSRSGGSSLAASASEAPPATTFSERLAGLRTEEAFRKERQAKIRSVRSNAFGIGKDEMDVFKNDAVEIPNVPLAPPTFTRDQVLGTNKSTSGFLARSRTMPSGTLTYGATDGRTNDASKSLTLGPTCEEEQPSYELYSSFHLSRRILPHNVLTRGVSGKKSYNVKDLLLNVKAPDFSLPDIEQDIVVFAILAKKSEPRSRMPRVGKKDEDRGNYMVMTLTDLDFEVDLFLFDSGFERFWKLSEGTVLAILNPNIMPPPPGRQDTGRFSLVINSDEDTILEIGIARDLGFCKSVKKDGNPCGSWVNKKRTEFCEFHTNQAVKKQKSSRIEMNSSGFGGPNRSGKSASGGDEWSPWGWGIRKREKEKPKERKDSNGKFDRETGTHWFVSRSMSSADLIDGKDMSLGDRKERAEFLKRSLEAKEKEREIMNKLGQIGSAAGREYMKLTGAKAATSAQEAGGSEISARPPSTADSAQSLLSLDFLRGRGADRHIHLSPVKRKRNDSSQSSVVTTTSNGSSALGWGKGVKEKLSSMKAAGGEGQPPRTRSPRKKTRFVTERGIREAGRESLGADLSARPGMADFDDDELEIVHS
ncbi:Zinc finger, Mcm10/DnaG-type [Cordyceps fumosorosea ARSEF 2679]|uniref:Zinc finger, Mcm10/DnaG-type n=1 Tax=Cordyceps fumosorosea (strain ARSEF 2679) TaxID=1081104 RepID=A0A167WIZ8_CORFA|nr:Zinc finger, Mcm10/DnaG-type [Cordyceps fumosorosea ARSEF 2679]OAA63848.1 Zinc finger, Mcm10/DnaG-type [Cordyceps fumosorosea ARSEF 2679]